MAAGWAVWCVAAFATVLLRDVCASHDASAEAQQSPQNRVAIGSWQVTTGQLQDFRSLREDHAAGAAAHEAEEKTQEPLVEHEVIHTSDLEVACMLLGAVTLVVSLFYLVNWPDDDIRFYTWSIISMTISIFSAVLLFHGISEMSGYITDYMNSWGLVAFHFWHCTMYFVAMQVIVGYEAGIIGEDDGYQHINLDGEKWTLGDGMRADYGRELTPGEELRVRSNIGKRSHIRDEWGNEVPVVKRNLGMEQRKRRMKCFAGLLSHLAAFATIDAGGVLMHTDVFAAAPYMATIPVVTTTAMVILFFWLSHKFRDGRFQAAKQAGRQGRRVAMCEEYVVDAENDILALASSFLLIQVIRFQISGVLPDSEGIERPEKPHDEAVVVHLLLFGLLCAISASVCSVPVSQMAMMEEEERGILFRIASIGMSFFGMGFAWCILWGVRWMCVIIPFIDMETMIGRIECALILSVFSMCSVFLLDAISDYAKARGYKNLGPLAIETLIEALGLLVGFSWEQCFAHGVSVVSSRTPHAHLTKLGLGISVLLLLVRPWRRYILTKVMYLEEYRKIYSQEKIDDSRPLSSRDLARSDGPESTGRDSKMP